jgi:hypothetical protein
MLKIISLFLFFNLSAHCFDLDEKKIVLPADLSGVSGDVSSLAFSLRYKILDKKLIEIKLNSKNDTISKFMQTLIYSYKNMDTKLFTTLVSAKDKSVLSVMSPEKIKGVMDLLAQAENPFIKLVYGYKGGYVVWWSADNFVQERKIFIKNVKGSFYISKLHASSDDDTFSNIELFLQFQKFNKYKAKAALRSVSINALEKKNFEFQLEKPGSYLTLFKEGDDEAFVHVIDNYKSDNFRFSDHDSNLKKISLTFSGKNFKGLGKRKVYFIESSYPIGKLTSEHFKQSSFITVNKIAP